MNGPVVRRAPIERLRIRFPVGFAGTGMAPNTVVERTAVLVAALQGVITQILRQRLQLAPAKAKAFVADVCTMLIMGIRTNSKEARHP